MRRHNHRPSDLVNAPRAAPHLVDDDKIAAREDLCLDAAEVIEAQHGLPTPIDPVR